MVTIIVKHAEHPIYIGGFDASNYSFDEMNFRSIIQKKLQRPLLDYIYDTARGGTDPTPCEVPSHYGVIARNVRKAVDSLIDYRQEDSEACKDANTLRIELYLGGNKVRNCANIESNMPYSISEDIFNSHEFGGILSDFMAYFENKAKENTVRRALVLSKATRYLTNKAKMLDGQLLKTAHQVRWEKIEAFPSDVRQYIYDKMKAGLPLDKDDLNAIYRGTVPS